MNALSRLFQRMTTGQSLTGDDIVALVLVAAMACSIAHLGTMVITRWGDQHTLFKSFVASVLVHVVCLLGLEVFEPLGSASFAANTESPPLQQAVSRMLVESETDILMDQSGNTPVPDQPAKPDFELHRMESPARELLAPEAIRPAEGVPPANPVTVDDVSPLEETIAELPSFPVESGRTGPPRPSATELSPDLDPRLTDATPKISAMERERLSTFQGSLETTPSKIDRTVDGGTFENFALELQPERTAPLMLDQSPESDTVVSPEAMKDTVLRQRAAPSTSPQPLADAGVLPGPTPPAPAGQTPMMQRPRLSRSGDRQADRQRFVPNPDRTPTTPVPLSDSYDEVRISSGFDRTKETFAPTSGLIEFDAPLNRRRNELPATYQLRTLEMRREAARRFGGTRESEQAVEAALQWFAGVQASDGHWDAERFGAGQVKEDENGVDRDFAGIDADTGLTSLVILSFLGASYTNQDGKYAIHVDQALDWLISQQGSDGNLAGGARHYARMYCHAMATYALAEALAMQRDSLSMEPLVDPEFIAAGQRAANSAASAMTSAQTGIPPLPLVLESGGSTEVTSRMMAWNARRVDELRLRTALMRAINYTLSQQNPRDGGWRYRAGQEGDMSMFGWQLMSLKSAELAGVQINPIVRSRMEMFLERRRLGTHGGLYAYRREEPPNPVMTAEGLFCRQMLRLDNDPRAVREAMNYLLDNSPRIASLNLYYWYYGTLAMHQHGGPEWDNWNVAVRESLITLQRRDGPMAGSWDPNGPWGRYGGRLYSTALATLTLEVYYRILPLYRMNER